MRKLIIKIIRLYQKTPHICHSYCRYYPTCSDYAIEAINYFGVLKGGLLSIRRIFRCSPWGGYGYDPVIKEDMYEKNN
ncbi:MAG: membrane protein insertion efficiency factor YidD [Bacilli bacterium]|nr:membrane protein insertion efficiency factor YidD [Bacilli bacterium]